MEIPQIEIIKKTYFYQTVDMVRHPIAPHISKIIKAPTEYQQSANIVTSYLQEKIVYTSMVLEARNVSNGGRRLMRQAPQKKRSLTLGFQP